MLEFGSVVVAGKRLPKSGLPDFRWSFVLVVRPLKLESNENDSEVFGRELELCFRLLILVKYPWLSLDFKRSLEANLFTFGEGLFLKAGKRYVDFGLFRVVGKW